MVQLYLSQELRPQVVEEQVLREHQELLAVEEVEVVHQELVVLQEQVVARELEEHQVQVGPQEHQEVLVLVE